MIGKIIAHYRITARIGEGGMGEVYLADDTSLGRKVALKCLPAALRQDPIAHKRFLREAKSAAALDHPYICSIHEVGEAEGADYIVMEYVYGQTLRDKLEAGPLPLKVAVWIAVEVCEALELAHGQGIIHRDLKPANIMLTQQGHAKVMDFGLAKQLERAKPTSTGGDQETAAMLTEEGLVIGTPAYMSPEQLRGQSVDARSDIFSFGVVFYEMLTGVHPFREVNTMDTVGAVLNKEPAPLSRYLRSVPESLQPIVSRMLAKKVADRYPEVRMLREDLVKALKQLEQAEAGAWRKMGRPAIVVPALAVMICLGYVAGTALYQNHKARWAHTVVLPEIQKLIARDDYTAAFKLVSRAAKHDPDVRELESQVSGFISVETAPSGAEVFIKDYSNITGEWDRIGRSPLQKVRVPRYYKRWKIELPGYEPVEGARMIYRPPSPAVIKVRLDKAGTIPAGMVRIQGGKFTPRLGGLDGKTHPELPLADYLLDRYEVSNRQFREFIEAGGYSKREFWKQRFVKDGRELAWEEAMKLFVDKTGRPGPATWEAGDCPPGQNEYPVTGISWFEAAAYAEFAGKSLPTVYHWNWAIVSPDDPDIFTHDYLGLIIPLSNFAGRGTAPAGIFQGMTPHGVYDMAGNVKEWCWNETPEGQRLILGGAWNEPQYLFPNADQYPPFLREANFGFRCMKQLVGEEADPRADRTIAFAKPLPPQEPCSDEVFKVYRRLYDYNKSAPLNARLELAEDVNRYTRLEKVSFEAAYGEERMSAYLFIPRGGTPPFQTIVYWPGISALWVQSFFGAVTKDAFDAYTRNNRAFVYPVLFGTFDRVLPREKYDKLPVLESARMQVKDFRRTLDYLETRPEFDLNKLAFKGLSWGAEWGARLPAIESRIKAAVLLAGGLRAGPPELNTVSFAPRIKIPMLLQNGRYDFVNPEDTNLKPLLRLFDTPEPDKGLKLYETGHSVWIKNEAFRDEFAFLDKYFGLAK